MTNNQYDEYIRCQVDKKYFIENYVKIHNIDEGLVQLIPNEFQEQLLKDFSTNRHTIRYADRCEGKTTIAAALFLHMICFEHDRTGVIIGFRNDAAAEILRIVLSAWNELPEWIRPNVVKQNRTILEFNNGIQIMSFGAGSDGWRGRGISFLFIDEFQCFQTRDLLRIKDCLLPTVMSGNTTRILMLSSR